MIYLLLFIMVVTFGFLYTFFEMAYLLTSKKQINREGNLYEFLSKPERVIITFLIGNNLCAVSASMFFRNIIGDGNRSQMIEGSLFVTFILFVFSEMIPKNIATYFHRKFFSIVTSFVWGTYVLFSPVILVVERIIKRFAVQDNRAETEREREVMAYISELRKQFPMKAMESYVDIIEETVRFMSSRVVDYAVYLSEINFIDFENPDFVLARNYDFSVVYKDTIDNVMGILKSKYIYLIEKGYISLKEALYEPLFVHETQTVENVVSLLSKSGYKESIVVDEHGNIKGVFSVSSIRDIILNVTRSHFVTVWGEDRLERLGRVCGDISIGNPSMSIHEFISQKLGGRVRPGSSMVVGKCKITVLSMKGGIIDRIIVDTRGGDNGPYF